MLVVLDGAALDCLKSCEGPLVGGAYIKIRAFLSIMKIVKSCIGSQFLIIEGLLLALSGRLLLTLLPRVEIEGHQAA